LVSFQTPVKESLDLDAYFDRIGWGGSTTPGQDTLAALLRAHMARIPFENFDVLLGRPPRLDLEGLQAKLVTARRGGYCFEQATLFAAVLEAIGFAPRRHSARVVLQAPRTESPRTHMFLTVPLPEGTFVVDPGFGSLAPRAPVPLDGGPGAGAATHWLTRDGAYWTLHARSADETIAAWVTTLEHDHPVDFVMANHYTATHPGSAFVNRVLLRALRGDGRVSVMNRDLTMVEDGTTRSSVLADRAALREIVATHFGFDLPEIETLRVPTIPEWR
jgi:N-hydroxyarylamine O-acetyltransferase